MSRMRCAVVTGPSVEDAKRQIAKSSSWANLVEIRVDLLKHRKDVALLRPLVLIPLILTDRGGTLDDYARLADFSPDYLDLDHTLPPCEFKGIKIIRSFHDFTSTPEDLESVFQKLQHTPADHYKIATYANTSTDALRMLLFVRKKRLLGICMGKEGIVSRLLCSMFGAPWVYAACEEGHESAPFQLCGENLPHLNKDTTLYGLIGDPVDKSISHITHNQTFQEKNFNGFYVKMRVTKQELSPFIKLAGECGFQGFSVTMPLKECFGGGSINTLKWNGSVYEGISTDGKGALKALKFPLKGLKVVLIGAGGAARSIAEAVLEAGGKLIILNRTFSKAERLAHTLGCPSAPLDHFKNVANEGYDLLIQSTSVGMGDGKSPIPTDLLLPNKHLLEVISKPKETPLVKAALKKGCTVTYGVEMFHAQAKYQFDWWLH